MTNRTHHATIPSTTSPLSISASDAKPLAQINQKILAPGETLPLVQLNDGSTVQTGTFATLIHNIKLYDKKPDAALAAEIQAALPTLAKIGLFELFPAECWQARASAGQRLVAELLQHEDLT